MNFSQFLTTTFGAWAQSLPLPWFAFIGAFVEELTPIPASLIMTILGSLSAVRGYGFFIITGLSLIATVGKEIGYILVYFVGDKSEDLILKKFGRFFGVKNEQIEAIGKHLNHGWKDDVIIFIFRALPIMPTMAVSLICGIIKVNFKSYIVASFFGTLVRNGIYLYLGFSGIEILNSFDNHEVFKGNLLMWTILGIIAIGGVILFWKRKEIKSRFKL